MLWLMTMGRRLNGVYAAFMLVAFMMGIAGALQAPTLSLFLSREVGAQPFWVGLFYTVNAHCRHSGQPGAGLNAPTAGAIAGG
ncbi:transport protein [Klebsiella michiganensis]|uniref:Transport protein n=1 Tax=Klebsiella michiganensis TaxID=1134687 RepID=A0A7H4M033_9ENTR|nr:transport protein [Klebsiella michiganensis]